MSTPIISIVTPAYNEEKNLPVFYERLKKTAAEHRYDWEWVIIDDHSKDATFSVACELAEKDSRVRVFRLGKNSGAHRAALCGFAQVRGRCAMTMAADLQDPPECIPLLLSEWEKGAHTVWAVREAREGVSWMTKLTSRIYFYLLRNLAGLPQLPPTGADFFLIDRLVIDGLAKFNETNTNVFALIAWMGFKQASVSYVKAARLHGKSGWTLRQKIKLLVDSIASFSFLPLRVMSYLGLGLAFLSMSYGFIVLVNYARGNSVHGWSSLMFAVSMMGSVQMVMLGTLGEYLWRTLDQTRKRPPYLIEASSDNLAAGRPPLRALK
jgi:glycosyltransferase involved in cell wall biosynthesis